MRTSTHAEGHEDGLLMPDINAYGFDMERRAYWFYAFLSEDGRRVKVGTVGREERLDPRRAEVERDCREPGLRKAAWIRIDGLNQHEAEDAEAGLRLWLTRDAGLVHYGRVDWLEVPDDRQVPDCQMLLDRALEAVMSWGR